MKYHFFATPFSWLYVEGIEQIGKAMQKSDISFPIHYTNLHHSPYVPQIDGGFHTVPCLIYFQTA